MSDETQSTAARTSQVSLGEPLCAQLRAAWKRGERLEIENLVGNVAEPQRTGVLRDLLCQELELRWESGEEPTRADYARRFPGHVPLIEAIFSERRPLSPKHIGRYKVIRRLGGGGFGHVYLCRDETIERDVAVKVPRRDRLSSQEAKDAFFREARMVARLEDHPNIVRLYDCDEDNGQCFLVYKLIDGQSLGERMERGSIPVVEATSIIAQVAEALHHAHGKNLFHRDIKPGNILLDRDGKPWVTDFGLAVREEELAGERGRRSGTYPYMSPEQVRAEGHRIDGRTDIYSLGVVLYELLCGRRPFVGKSTDVFEQILHQDARPPRQIVYTIPRELERICLKAMAKQMSARYPTARDMAEELRLAVSDEEASVSCVPPLAPPKPAPSSDRSFPVMPKGLRSFGPEDRAFFLELLPGPRDRDGLPEALRFWKTRIESRSAEVAFAVGLIYGPSGCGKSSLVRAGLLPRLAPSVRALYVEAIAENLEARLVKELRKTCPDLRPDQELPDLLASVRRGQGVPAGTKLLLVIDQVEQWLHAHGHDMERTRLAAALRHADGERVQVLLLVRDDFWMGISRLFDCLEINLDREQNTRAVDLFDPAHARRVLRMFGYAFGQIPAGPADMTGEQDVFLNQAVAELSEDGRVIPVRLSLFADLMKDRPWTPASLVKVGGAEGVGVRFLEETFTARTAVPDHRALEKPARAVLQALLPERGTDIKGQMRSRQELAHACGLPPDQPRFARLLNVLDRELHIITPTEPESVSEPPADERATAATSIPASAGTLPAPSPPYYQLTHDFLVPPLRHWLTLERHKTWRGRAELCLEERSAQWTRAPQSRFLPSAWEYLRIATGVPKRKRTTQQQAVMRAAARYYGVRFCAWLALGLVVIFFLYQWAAGRRGQAATLVDTLLSATPESFPDALEKLEPFRDLAVPVLQERYRNAAGGSREQLHAALALAAFDEPDEAFLIDAIASAPGAECKNIVAALQLVKGRVVDRLFAKYASSHPPGMVWLRCAVVLLQLGETEAARQILKVGPDPTRRTMFIDQFKGWHGDLTILAKAIDADNDPDFRSGLCIAVGGISPESLSSEEVYSLRQALLHLYQSAPDGGTHSAADWALRQWRVPLPNLDQAARPMNGRRWFINSLGMTLVEIPNRTFLMGDRDPRIVNARLHSVTVSKPFFVASCEVTAQQFQRFVDDKDPALVKPKSWRPHKNPTCPAQRIDWYAAVAFCNWLSKIEGRTPCYIQKKDLTWSYDASRNGYRLLTEAEWEHACRAGTTTPFSFGSDPVQLTEHGIFVRNSGSEVQPVGSKRPNAFGLFDMHGNVSEWCWDWYGPYVANAIDPQGPASGEGRVVRGGGYHVIEPMGCGSAIRSHLAPLKTSPVNGFRVACNAHP
jgi:serine/threonine protein kinase/formylglycine-generating enzyme required for sulfatase activity